MTMLTPSPPIAVAVAQTSSAGGRSTNQDAMASIRHDDLACLVIADGAGGHAGGEIAAAIVVQSITDKFVEEATFSTRAIRSCTDRAAANVAQRQAADSQLRHMTATVAMLVIDACKRRAIWTHLGDTRIYLFRRNRIVSVTRDHSLVQQFVDAGYCKPEQLRGHPQRSKLFAAIGAGTGADGDLAQASTDVEDGDVFLMCSDGFWEWLDETDMEQTLAMATSAHDWLAEMTRVVQKTGGKAATAQDNYTAFAVWIGEPNDVTVRR